MNLGFKVVDRLVTWCLVLRLVQSGSEKQVMVGQKVEITIYLQLFQPTANKSQKYLAIYKAY